jgi:5-methylcytosine-specific restriction endonuclease McrA
MRSAARGSRRGHWYDAAAMPQALVLNATYEPLSVVPARRAVVLVIREKAELVESDGRRWASQSMSVPVPSVIRLLRYVRVPYQRRVPLNRRAVFVRDRHTCQYCGAPAENLDHVVPRSRGGSHTWENVVGACRRCNARKGDCTAEEVGLKLIATPRAPRLDGWVLIGLAQPHPSWHPYLPGFL